MNFFTELREGLGISWSAIRGNKMRSVLTTLGIVIGVVTVTLMGTAIEGLNQAFLKSISFIGADVLYVDRGNWINSSEMDWMQRQKRRRITLSQARSLEKQLTLAGAVTPVANVDHGIRYRNRHSDSATILGSTEQLMLTTGFTLAQGRFLSGPEGEGVGPAWLLGWRGARTPFH